MTCYRCDRCGKAISSDFMRYEQHIQVRRKASDSSALLWPKQWLDLCEDCSAKIEIFMDKGTFVE